MKKFFAGMLTAVLIGSLAVSALAATGAFTIEVHPINIQVNGETFTPTDVNGDAVPVFAYNGTTYAPLRALAEAYGLEVGYDAESNMATVVDPDAVPTPASDTTALDYSSWTAEEEAAYQEFKGMWEVHDGDGDMDIFTDVECKEEYSDTLDDFLAKHDASIVKFCKRFESEMPNDVRNIIILYRNGSEELWSDVYDTSPDGTGGVYGYE